ncbi:MIK1 [Symbiodinium sp. CCMP2456]|nr:MIK1 [Symbiodinium sp. CCMP2456]
MAPCWSVLLTQVMLLAAIREETSISELDEFADDSTVGRVKHARSEWSLAPEAPSSLVVDHHNDKCTDERLKLFAVLVKLGLPEHRLTGDHCNWQGVRCRDLYRCEVMSIALPQKDLKGEMSPGFKDLPALEELDLEGNPHLRGSLHVLAGFHILHTLNLAGTNVTGNLSDLGKQRTLRVLELSGTGVAGSLETVRRMKLMTSLGLSGTRVAGSIQELEAMKRLHTLDLSGATGIYGDINSLILLRDLQSASLANTKVSGRIIHAGWAGRLQQLQHLDLAGTSTTLIPSKTSTSSEPGDANPTSMQLVAFNSQIELPRLQSLDVSRCPLNTTPSGLLQHLYGCSSLVSLSAASSNITGTLHEESWSLLQYLDLSYNNLSHVEGLWAGTFVSLAANPPLTFAADLLRNAKDTGVHLDLADVDFTNARSEAAGLLQHGEIRMTDAVSHVDAEHGFGCHGLRDGFLQVTTSLFLPEAFCGCLVGWHGTGTKCRLCEQGKYSDKFNSSQCTPCPLGSDTQNMGSTLLKSCTCNVGRISTISGKPRCQCDRHTALWENQCMDCNELHLECPYPGSLAETALPQPGFARLLPLAPSASRCLDLVGNCSASPDRSELGCAPGYEGPLCSVCAERHRWTGKTCRRCEDDSAYALWPAVAASGALAAATILFMAWRQRSHGEEGTRPATTPTATYVLWPFLLAQGPVLLQLCQLWAVLVDLGDPVNSSYDGNQWLWEQEYVKWFQLTASAVLDALSLDCAYGRRARTLCALAAPCVPLLVLLLCMLVEVVAQEGTGVSLALRALSWLFIGGAFRCAKLLDCQMVDGGGEPLNDLAFRSELPHALCLDSHGDGRWADIIGKTCAVSYLFLIPAFLVYLIIKQYLLLMPSKRIASSAEYDGDALVLRVGEIKPPPHAATREEEPLDQLRAQHLLASAVAWSAVFFRGRVRFQLTDTGLSVQRIRRGEWEEENEMEFDADSMVSTVLERKTDADLQRCHTITRMLVERYILKKAGKSDRILAGANELFFKYALCRDVWVEVALKLVAVALVAAASTFKSLFLTLGLTLSTAVGVGALKPYRQRQANDLQCLCFGCLSVAAVGFCCSRPWLARGALAAPFTVAGTQALRPDGPEALALRLWEAARKEWSVLETGQPIELSVDTVSFV